MGQRRGTFIFGGILLLFGIRNYTTSRKTIQRDLLRKRSQDYWAPKQLSNSSSSGTTKNEADRVLEKQTPSPETGKVESSMSVVDENKVDAADPGVVGTEQHVETPLSVHSSGDDVSNATNETAIIATQLTATKPSAAQDLVTESNQQLNNNTTVSSPQRLTAAEQNVTAFLQNETSNAVADDAGTMSMSSNETHLVKKIDNNATNTSLATSDTNLVSTKPKTDQTPNAPINATEVSLKRKARNSKRIVNVTLPQVVRSNATADVKIGSNNNTDFGRNATVDINTNDTSSTINTTDGAISGSSMVDTGSANSPQTHDVQTSVKQKKAKLKPTTTDEKADFSPVNSTANSNFKLPPSKNAVKEPRQKQKHKHKGPTPIPNVLIAGVQKGGTTSIAHYLNETQNACFSDPIARISKGEGKESHFFDNFKTYNSSGLEYYQRVFEHCEGKQLIVDGTPEFMKTGERIFDTYTKHGSLDKLKIIISLREPVSREISWYNHRLRDCPEQAYARSVCNAETNESVPFVDVVQQELAWKLSNNETRNVYGTYVQYLKVFFELFDRKNILILSYDEAKSNPKTLLQRIHKFLDLPGKPKQLPHDNSDKGKHEMPPCAVQRALARRFKPYNQELFKLLEENPGPKMEQRPFPKFTNECFNEDFPEDEPDPFQKTLPKPRKRIIPNVLIAGAYQTLTSAVSNYCSKIMNGCQPDPVGSIDDESSTATHFFDNSNKFKKGLAFYQSLFEQCPSNATAVFDASADMILYSRRVRELYELQGAAETVKMIFILRDPVYREIEAFQNRAQKCKEDAKVDVCSKEGDPVAFEPFIEHTVITKLQNKKLNYMISVYATYLKDWFELWDRKQILILRYEELENRPKRFLGRIHDFLGIKAPATPNNLGLVSPKIEASCEIRERMSTHFHEHNQALYALLEANPGPKMEQHPFPEFETHKCTS